MYTYICSHRLIYFAGMKGKQDALVEELFLNYFSEEKFIGDRTILLAAAEKVRVCGCRCMFVVYIFVCVYIHTCEEKFIGFRTNFLTLSVSLSLTLSPSLSRSLSRSLYFFLSSLSLSLSCSLARARALSSFLALSLTHTLCLFVDVCVLYCASYTYNA